MPSIPLNKIDRQILELRLSDVNAQDYLPDVEKIIAGEASPWEIVELIRVIGMTSELRGLATSAGKALSKLEEPMKKKTKCPMCTAEIEVITGMVTHCPRCGAGLLLSRGIA